MNQTNANKVLLPDMNGAIIPKVRVSIYTPDGTPISTAFSYWDTDANYDLPLRVALESVDQVHGDGFWQKVRVGFDDSMKSNQIAAFSASETRGFLFFNPNVQATAFEVVHEIGHGIEKFGFDSIGRYATHRDTEFTQWRQAVRNSQAYQRLQTIEGQKEQAFVGVVGKKSVFVNHETVEYLLYWHGLWARSYAQYIGLTAGDSEMLKAIASQSDSLIRQVMYPRQWGVNDYDQIGQEIENLFLKRKWIR